MHKENKMDPNQKTWKSPKKRQLRRSQGMADWCSGSVRKNNTQELVELVLEK